MKGLLLPTSKKDFKTTDVAVLTLARCMLANGFSLQEVKKELYNTINQAQCLETKSDKDARKREIKKAVDKLHETEFCPME